MRWRSCSSKSSGAARHPLMSRCSVKMMAGNPMRTARAQLRRIVPAAVGDWGRLYPMRTRCAHECRLAAPSGYPRTQSNQMAASDRSGCSEAVQQQLLSWCRPFGVRLRPRGTARGVIQVDSGSPLVTSVSAPRPRAAGLLGVTGLGGCRGGSGGRRRPRRTPSPTGRAATVALRRPRRRVERTG